MRILKGAALALCVVAAPAVAQTAEFESAGIRYSIPAPEGYCADGPAVDAYRKQRQGEDDLPDVVMARCSQSGPARTDYFTIRFRRSAERVERTRLLVDLARALPDAAKDSDFGGEGRRDLESRLSKANSTQTTVDAGIRPIAVDDMCGYIGGKISGNTADGSPFPTVTTAGCITAIEGQRVEIFFYDQGEEPDRLVRAIHTVGAVARAISARRQ